MTDDRNELVGPRAASLKAETKWYLRLAWTFVVLGGVVAVGAVVVLFRETKPLDLGNLSSIGSFLQGTVASLWALAGLLFIYAAFVAQKRQLQLQSHQAESQREQHEQEQEAQTRAIEEQQRQFKVQIESIRRQSFENSFFQLLNLHNQLASQMSLDRNEQGIIGPTPLTYIGRACFNPLYRQLHGMYQTKVKKSANLGDERQIVINTYLEFYQYHQGELGNYFRNLYHIIEFVKSSEILDKRRYTSLAMAQLSAYELTMMFYNSITPLAEKFKPLVEEFGLLENLEKNLLLAQDHALFYAQDAYR